MDGKLQGRRIALFAADLFEDIELYYPYYRLDEEGAEVVVLGGTRRTYHGKKGLSAEAQTTPEEVTTGDFDALVLPGGYAPDHLRREERLLEMVREADQDGKPIAAICHAGWVLVSAGIVRGRRVTGYWSIKDDLVNAGAEYEDSQVVRDANLITSRYPNDLGAFCRTLIDSLA
ncbi:type 1 glutamine amidotransferase domain-containing protein [Thiohalorhabdus sp. Cl-TMA]|uniref:Type 1 glutamine amidotransferase domain-containing protein n=1 Tax=Thiohalorhabdus methylotrophus TaxID=3242694 RepID=A0ABV4TUR8_9GAMM